MGVVWLALYYCFFVGTFIKVENQSDITIVGSISKKICTVHNDYSCGNLITNSTMSVWLLLSGFIFYFMEKSRKRIFLIGIFSLALVVILSYAEEHVSIDCNTNHCRNIVGALFPFWFLIPFSIVLIPFRDEVFHSWWNFSRVWLPIVAFLALITPSQSGWMMSWDSGATAFVLCLPYIIISILLIVIKSIVLIVKNKKTK